MPAYLDEVNSIKEYLNSNPEALKLVKYYTINKEYKNEKYTEYYEPKTEKLQTQLELPFDS